MSSTEDLKKAAKESILKRIPLGAEATTVLVGAVDFLEQPTIAFVRLAEGILMPSITEVSVGYNAFRMSTVSSKHLQSQHSENLNILLLFTSTYCKC